MLSATMEKLKLKEREEGEKKGREEGRREGIIELMKMYLMNRFDKVPEDLPERFKKIKDIRTLESLASRVYQCQSLDEIARLLDKTGGSDHF